MEPRPHAEDVKPDEHLHLVHDHEAHETVKEEAWACMLSLKPPESLESLGLRCFVVQSCKMHSFHCHNFSRLCHCYTIFTYFYRCFLIRPWIEALVPFAGKPVTSGSHKARDPSDKHKR